MLVNLWDTLGTILIGTLEEGFAYAIMALGIYITYKILDFPDLSVDGTFPLGGAITAILIVSGVDPVVTLFISFLAGALAGMITGFIHVKLKVRDLFAGIIMMTALYSINLRIAGRANLPFFTQATIFRNDFMKKLFPPILQKYQVVIVSLVIVIVMKLILDFYLSTKSGYLLRAAGDNDTLVTSLAKDKGVVKIIGLSIANAFVALSGSVYAQKVGYFEISSGTGSITIGLASVIIGINLFKGNSWLKTTTAVIIGSVLYKLCVAIAIFIGLNPSDLKLIMASLFLFILVISRDKKRKVKSNA